jgi:hypothetical protein
MVRKLKERGKFNFGATPGDGRFLRMYQQALATQALEAIEAFIAEKDPAEKAEVRKELEDLCRAVFAEAREYIGQARFAVVPGSVPEKTAYRRASDEGRALTETRFRTLNARSDEVAQSIIDLITPQRRAKTNG